MNTINLSHIRAWVERVAIAHYERHGPRYSICADMDGARVAPFFAVEVEGRRATLVGEQGIPMAIYQIEGEPGAEQVVVLHQRVDSYRDIL